MSATRLTSRAGTGAPWSSSATGRPKNTEIRSSQ
nr:MAG TPA: hypothetical protein [Caudoviricetes sp.]